MRVEVELEDLAGRPRVLSFYGIDSSAVGDRVMVLVGLARRWGTIVEIDPADEGTNLPSIRARAAPEVPEDW